MSGTMSIKELGIVTPKGEFCLYCDFLRYVSKEMGQTYYGCSAKTCKKLP